MNIRRLKEYKMTTMRTDFIPKVSHTSTQEVKEELRTFSIGLGGGVFATLLSWLAFSWIGQYLGWLTIDITLGESWSVAAAYEFVVNNLGGALAAFVVVAAAYGYYLVGLKKGLSLHQLSLLEVRKFTVKLQAFSSLFFGIGVLWTAIGMRGALLVALGDLDADSAAQLGAFEILKRLVDGGILIALSTTIVGGFGGYLLKLIETFAVAADIQALAAAEEDSKNRVLLNLLETIAQNTNKSPSNEGSAS
jgi:hypothetical protein